MILSEEEEEDIDIWSTQNFSEDYNRQAAEINPVYEPYIDFKIEPLETSMINIDENSIRRTLNPCNNGDSIKIFMFGGSSTWGWGARDEHTIPSEFSKLACERGLNVEVTNFGNPSYVNNQNVVKFIFELKNGNIPDVVIFLTGSNDFYSAYDNLKAGVPINYKKRKKEYNKGNSLNLKNYINNFPIVNLFFQAKKKLKKETEFETLSNETIKVLESNADLVKNLEKVYGFKSFFFLQPVICFKKELSRDEKSKIPGVKSLCNFFEMSYNKLDSRFIDFSNVFDDEFNSATVFFDYCHVLEQYNEFIARKMIEEIHLEDQYFSLK